MAVGATGVGKSTLMNAVVQGSENMELNEDCDFLLQYCVDNVGPDKDSSFQEVEEMLAELMA